MRTFSFKPPKEKIVIQPHLLNSNLVDVYLYDNIQLSEDKNKYFYDTYTLVLLDENNLYNKILNNFQDWIAIAQKEELNTQASLVVDMQMALNILGVK